MASLSFRRLLSAEYEASRRDAEVSFGAQRVASLGAQRVASFGAQRATSFDTAIAAVNP